MRSWRYPMFIPKPIGFVSSPHKNTSEIPKGLGAKHAAEGVLRIMPEFELGLTDIDGFSHLIVLWEFDRSQGFELLGKPPSDSRPHGVFATRSPRRPNPIALTVVELLRHDGVDLHVRGVDMLDGTPILDIKPYLSSIPPEKLRRGWLAKRKHEIGAQINSLPEPGNVPVGCVYHPFMDGSGDVSVFVLAGGKSTRMGMDKAFVDFEGRTLLMRALDLARSVTADVRIVGSREKFERFAPVVEDIFLERGPLGGIHAALKASETDLNIMLAVDMPFVSLAFLHYLIVLGETEHTAWAVVPRVNQLRQPLSAVYRRRFADSAEEALRAGRNRIDLLFSTAATRVIDEAELEGAGFSSKIFRNLNTLKDVEEQQRRA